MFHFLHYLISPLTFTIAIFCVTVGNTRRVITMDTMNCLYYETYNIMCEILVFRLGAVEDFILRGCCIALAGNLLPSLSDSVSIYFTGLSSQRGNIYFLCSWTLEDGSDTLYRNVFRKLPNKASQL